MGIGQCVKGVIYDAVDENLRMGIGTSILHELVVIRLYTKIWEEVPNRVFNSVSTWSIL